MKELRRLGPAVLMSVVFILLLSGCETVQWTDTGKRYHEVAAPDVVLRFARWDYITISRPEYRERGFIRYLKREELNPAFSQLGLRRDTAVVVVGWTYQADVLENLVSEWRSVLKDCGFRRVICLRGSSSDDINGMPILDDSNFPTNATKQNAKL